MRFRQSFSVSAISLAEHESDPIVLNLHREHDLTITLTSSDADGQRLDHLRCTVETAFQPGRAVLRSFTHLESGRLPPGHLPRDQWKKDHAEVDSDGNIVDNYILPLYLMPEAFRVFANKLDAELHCAAEDAVGVLRWRSRTLGPRHPFSSRGGEWTSDETHWHHLPVTTGVTHADIAHLDVTAPTVAELQELLDAEELEPLPHALFREAWSQRSANPGSSLLIGMAALEVAVKDYIAVCVPEAAWLAKNVPSPPVEKIIKEYLPNLNPPHDGSRMAQVDDDTIKVLKAAVGYRNDLAHRGVEITHKRLVKTLRAVRNMLWTFDVARGHAWAGAHRSPLNEDLSVGYRRL